MIILTWKVKKFNATDCVNKYIVYIYHIQKNMSSFLP